jgi:hypothetical protein
MLPFKPNVTVTQSSDGSVLTATDDSNYGTNSDGINDNTIVTRVITIFDQNNVQIGGPINMAQDTPITFPITADGFSRFHLAFSTAVPVLYQADVKYLSVQYYKNVQLNLAPKLRCSCPVNDNLIKYMSIATELYNAAISAFMTGDDVSAALNITDCNTYINKALQC